MATYVATVVERVEHHAEITTPDGMTEEEVKQFIVMKMFMNNVHVDIKELKEVVKQ